MLVSSAINGLPILSKVFDYGPYVAACTTFFVLFGITYPLLCLHWGRLVRLRRMYTNFTINDTLVYPIYMATATSLLAAHPQINNQWKSASWHYGVFATGVVLALVICWWEVRTGKYSLKTQWVPWKIWHTIIFPVVFYWIVSTMPVVLSLKDPLGTGVVLFGAAIFIMTTIIDGWMPGAHALWRKLSAILKLGAR